MSTEADELKARLKKANAQATQAKMDLRKAVAAAAESSRRTA